ncbi:MAG: MFS transporter [Desulfobacterales bacterium]
MSPHTPAHRRYVVGLQYFLHFAVMGIYLPYFNLYCHQLGLSGSQIGILGGVRTAATVIFPLIWGHLADRFNIRRPLYIACTLGATVVWAAFVVTDRFGPMALLMGLYGLFYAPLISFLEAFAMESLGKEKRRYGALRAWGTLGFILISLGLGPLIGPAAMKMIVVLILAGSALQALSALALPPVIRAPGTVWGATLKSYAKLPVVGFLAAAFLMLVSHGAYYNFFSIHLAELGYSGTIIGLSWALASAGEMVVMFLSASLFGRVHLKRVLLASFGVAALRWIILAEMTHPAALLGSQLLHTITYGTFHMASILYIEEASSANNKTMGQALNNALTYGLGLMVGFFGSGVLYQQAGPRVMFWASAGTALLAALIFGLTQTKPVTSMGRT